jgi:ornithine cyclodeaminase/alanine dehydrogenase-like protein (mu-crystallin family)
MLVLNRGEVEELIDIDALIDALAGAMVDLSSGRASVPNRVGARVDEEVAGDTPARARWDESAMTAGRAVTPRALRSPGSRARGRTRRT